MLAAANNPAASQCASSRPIQPSSQKQAITTGIAAMRESVRILGRLKGMARTVATLSAAPEMIMDFLGHRAGNAGRGLKIPQRGGRNSACRAEMVQQRTLARRANAGNLVERRFGNSGRA